MAIGRSRLVERQALATFLDRLHEADQPSAELERIRRKGGAITRKKIRTLIPRDLEPLSAHSLPANVAIEPGRLTVTFLTLEGLTEAMYALARVIEAEGDMLAQQYEIRQPPNMDAAELEMTVMMRELEALEKAKSEKCSPRVISTHPPCREA
jgi:hypothetical protein